MDNELYIGLYDSHENSFHTKKLKLISMKWAGALLYILCNKCILHKDGLWLSHYKTEISNKSYFYKDIKK